MDTLTRRDFEELIAAEGTHCVSLYMPTHRVGGPDVREDGTRLANLIRRAEEELRASGIKGSKLQTILDSLHQLRRDGSLTLDRGEGLAIFFDGFAGDGRRVYRLPLVCREQVVVGRCLHLRPLLPLFEGNGRFYILAVSQNNVRLLEGNRFSVTEIRDERLPKNLHEALNIDEFQQALQFSSMRGAGGGPGSRSNASFHGHGGSNLDVRKSDELIPYLRRIDRALDEIIGANRAPLVFAGVEYLFPIFKEASQYHELVCEPLTGNFDDASPGDLHAAAWPLVEGGFQRLREAELERLRTPQDRKPHSTDVAEILAASRHGRIETLFLADGHEEFGQIEDDAETGDLHEALGALGSAHGEDLLNVAAVETLRAGGKVFTVPSDQIPGEAGAAARFRWAVDPIQSPAVATA